MSRIEGFLESLVEHSFARAFRARLQPVEIAKRLFREMEDGRIVGVSSILVPNEYEVRLSSEDFATFAPISSSLERDLEQYLTRAARERGYSFPGRLGIRVEEDVSVERRHLRVLSRLIDQPSGVQEEYLEATSVMPRIVLDAPSSSISAPGPAAQLLVGDASYWLESEVVTIGRGLENAIVLEDSRISRIHVTLRQSQGTWSIRDEGSTNGTTVNGRSVSQQTLRHGDRLSLGGLEVRFQQR